jgi:hypothetical protein
MKNKQRALVVAWLVGIIVIMAIAGGVYLYQNKEIETLLTYVRNNSLSTSPVVDSVGMISVLDGEDDTGKSPIVSHKPSDNLKRFLGSWEINDNNSSLWFGFNLNAHTPIDEVYGSYCAGTSNGDRIDCNPYDRDSMIGKLVDDTIYITFVNDYGGGIGKATLKYNLDNTLTWTITQNPEGEFYIPENASMNRASENR